EDVTGIGESVGADRPQVRQLERRAEVLADIAARLGVEELDPEAQAARNHDDLLRRRRDAPELGVEAQPALLRNDKELAVGIVEKTVAHRTIRRVQVDAASVLRGGTS